MLGKSFDELTAAERAFILNYVGECRFNAKRAYLASHPESEPASATNSAHRMKKKLNYFIEEKLDEILGSKELVARQILAELTEMSFAEKDDEIYGPQVKLKAIELIQKQLGLQNQKIDATINGSMDFNITIGEDE